MIYSADANSRLANSQLVNSRLAKSHSEKSRLVSDKSLPERQLSTRSFPLGKPLGTGEPAQLEGDSRFEETEAPLPESRKDKFDLEQVDQLDLEQHDLELATLIDARIELRLPGRIRHLTVFTTENAVILSGECSTFYTKQVAQHAAMGVLEYEQLINNIDVRTAK